MALFRKKDPDIEEEDNLEEGRKITKNLRDLKPENKKKRKEPPKPWGKRERIVVLTILIATTIISAILLFSHSTQFRDRKSFKNLSKFDLKSLNIFKGETIVIEKQ